MHIEFHWDSYEQQLTYCNQRIAMILSLGVCAPVLLLCLAVFPWVFPRYAFLVEKPVIPMVLLFAAYWLHVYFLFRHMQKEKGLDVHGTPLKTEGGR